MQKITRNEASLHNSKMRAYYLEKFNHKCVECGDTERLELDHIIAITEGGDNSESNIQVLCKICNVKKGGKRYAGAEHHSRKNPKQNKYTAYSLRIEPEQLDKLKKLAKENGTSVNHEIRQGIRLVLKHGD